MTITLVDIINYMQTLLYKSSLKSAYGTVTCILVFSYILNAYIRVYMYMYYVWVCNCRHMLMEMYTLVVKALTCAVLTDQCFPLHDTASVDNVLHLLFTTNILAEEVVPVVEARIFHTYLHWQLMTSCSSSFFFTYQRHIMASILPVPSRLILNTYIVSASVHRASKHERSSYMPYFQFFHHPSSSSLNLR